MEYKCVLVSRKPIYEEENNIIIKYMNDNKIIIIINYELKIWEWNYYFNIKNIIIIIILNLHILLLKSRNK